MIDETSHLVGCDRFIPELTDLLIVETEQLHVDLTVQYLVFVISPIWLKHLVANLLCKSDLVGERIAIKTNDSDSE